MTDRMEVAPIAEGHLSTTIESDTEKNASTSLPSVADRTPAARGALSRDDRNGLLSRLTGRTIEHVDLTDRHLRTLAAEQQREVS